MLRSILLINMLSRLRTHFLSYLLEYILRFIFWTCRWDVIGESKLSRAIDDGRPILLPVWHGRMLFPIFYLYKNRIEWSALASRHKDAEIMALILKRMGFRLIRGSSSKGGREAINNIADTFRLGGRVAITSDGPKGPIHIAKPNSIATAIEHDAIIITISGSASRSWVLRSWDRFMLPKPFSKVIINIAKPLDIDTTSPEKIIDISGQYITVNQNEADAMSEGTL